MCILGLGYVWRRTRQRQPSFITLLPDHLLSQIVKDFLVLPVHVYASFLRVCRKWRSVAQRDHWLQAVIWTSRTEEHVDFCSHLAVTYCDALPQKTRRLHTLRWTTAREPQGEFPTTLRSLWLICGSVGPSSLASLSSSSLHTLSLCISTSQAESTLIPLRQLQHLKHFMIRAPLKLRCLADWFPRSAGTLTLLRLSSIEPQNLEFLAGLTALHVLKLNYKGLQQPLPHLPRLEELWICHGRLDDYHIGSSVRKLILHDTHMEFKPLERLASHLVSLETTKQGLLHAPTLRKMIHLEHVRTQRIACFTNLFAPQDVILQFEILAELPHLTSLDLRHSSIADFRWLSKLPQLRLLDLRMCYIQEKTLPLLPRLEVFGLPEDFLYSHLVDYLRILSSLRTVIVTFREQPAQGLGPFHFQVIMHFCHAHNAYSHLQRKNCWNC